MPGLTQTRDAALAHLRQAMPDIKRMDVFCGDLDVDGLAHKGVNSGSALFVTFASAVNVGDCLDFDMRASFVAFCVSRKGKKEEREADALALAERTAHALHGSPFGLASLSPAKVLGISPVEDDDVDKSGVNVWAVLWEHNLVFEGVTP